jgi:hypothetical protein
MVPVIDIERGPKFPFEIIIVLQFSEGALPESIQDSVVLSVITMKVIEYCGLDFLRHRPPLTAGGPGK